MKLGEYRVVVTLWPSLFFIVLMPLFISLGVWQLSRANEKILILESLEYKKASVPKSIGSIDVDADENIRIHFTGEVLGRQQFLLDNKVHNTAVGYELITPVKLHDDGRIVLVSRGWVALGGSRSKLPNVELKTTALVNATGLFTQPSKGYTIGEALDSEVETWPRVIQYLDYKQIAEVLGGSVIEGVVQLDKPLGREYPKLWKPVAFRAEKHYGYAAQWFAFALVLLVLYIVLNIKKEE